MGKSYAMKDLILLVGRITSYLNPDVMAKISIQQTEAWESISDAIVRQALSHQNPNSPSCNETSQHLPPLPAFTFVLVCIGVRKSWCLSCLPAEKAPEVWTSLVFPTFLHRVALSTFLNKDLLACFSISHFVLR